MTNVRVNKLETLKDILRTMDKAVVAYSGGMDSSMLLAVATEVLSDKVVAVTAVSPMRPSKELQRARQLTSQLNVKHLIIESDDFRDKRVKFNMKERCYFCKRSLFKKLKELAKENNLGFILEASNMDDLGAFRPGFKAVKELGIRSPLMESGLNKQEISQISKELNLSTWNIPSQSCLLTRFPYYSKVEEEDLRKVEQAEEFLNNLGFSQVRVRVRKDLARIEFEKKYIQKAVVQNIQEKIIKKFRSLGFNYVTLDLEGYRTGSLDI